MSTLKKIEPYWNFFHLIAILVVIILVIWTNAVPDFFCQFNTTQRALITSSLSAIIAILLIYFSFLANNRLQYFHAVRALLQEMRHNSEEIENFLPNFKAAYGNSENLFVQRWIAKTHSYTNWGDGENFHLKYLPSQAYFNFVNKGYIIQNEYLQFPSESISHFYQFCTEFSRDLQIMENYIRGLKQGRLQTPILIPLSRFPRTFRSPEEICKFLTDEFYPYYAEKNDLNEGIIGEYKKTVASLKEHEWLVTDGGSMNNVWQKIKNDNRPLSKRTSVGIGLVIFGLLVTMILVSVYGSTPITGPIFVSLGVGIYFLGLTVAVNGLIAQDENEGLLNKITELSEKIERLQK